MHNTIIREYLKFTKHAFKSYQLQKQEPASYIIMLIISCFMACHCFFLSCPPCIMFLFLSCPCKCMPGKSNPACTMNPISNENNLIEMKKGVYYHIWKLKWSWISLYLNYGNVIMHVGMRDIMDDYVPWRVSLIHYPEPSELQKDDPNKLKQMYDRPAAILTS